ncbi:hypothetical protein MNEG_13723 [Monoraphidium neglectum]|uniref:Uncharacterized protein n=1 Tax=Monoraphidium neglectum TaxID=145388 RepID=A0A0D2MGS6_9CHLO|nr:hypothetical protein MNEG_13723 [Monoraphidium neglectum]KIY94240.1 hypothetical protein MNEG_13723 [Monoraphidium neglectum]|eukprot:XP_013893260.1 hypothetical protein MNEG_13723 [Monoraphidium neglectum]
MAAQKAQLLLKFAQVAAKEAARHNGLPQVAVGAWEGLHGISAPGGHADASGAHPPSALALAPRLHAGGALGPQLPAAASLLQPHVLGGRDVPAALDQSTAAQHFPAAGLPWQNGAHHADPASPLAAAPGSALMPPRCVPDAASGAARGLLGARAPRQQQGARAGQQNQQQGGRRGGRAHSSSSVGLNKQIMTANTTSDLLAIVRQHGAGFDFFNISTAIARVPKLLGPHACGGQPLRACAVRAFVPPAQSPRAQPPGCRFSD